MTMQRSAFGVVKQGVTVSYNKIVLLHSVQHDRGDHDQPWRCACRAKGNVMMESDTVRDRRRTKFRKVVMSIWTRTENHSSINQSLSLSLKVGYGKAVMSASQR